MLANDNSAGNDGFVAKKEFKNIKELKGKTVATELGTVDHFLLLQALAKNGMTEKDIVFKNMTVPDAAAAFRQGKLDAAVIWQPSLNDVMKEGKANLLFTSKDVPGLIPDLLVFQENVVESARADVQKVVAAWFDVIDFIKQERRRSREDHGQGRRAEARGLQGVPARERSSSTSRRTCKAFEKSDDVHSLYGSGKVISDFLVAAGLMKKSARLRSGARAEVCQRAEEIARGASASPSRRFVADRSTSIRPRQRTTGGRGSSAPTRGAARRWFALRRDIPRWLYYCAAVAGFLLVLICALVGLASQAQTQTSIFPARRGLGDGDRAFRRTTICGTISRSAFSASPPAFCFQRRSPSRSASGWARSKLVEGVRPAAHRIRPLRAGARR